MRVNISTQLVDCKQVGFHADRFVFCLTVQKKYENAARFGGRRCWTGLRPLAVKVAVLPGSLNDWSRDITAGRNPKFYKDLLKTLVVGISSVYIYIYTLFIYISYIYTYFYVYIYIYL